MSSAERFPLVLFMLLFGLFLVYWPRLFSGLFVMLTNEEAKKKNSKFPLDPEERANWLVKTLLRSMWMYFAIVAVFLFYDGWVLLNSLFHNGS